MCCQVSKSHCTTLNSKRNRQQGNKEYWDSQQAGGYIIEQGIKNQWASKAKQNKFKKKHKVEKGDNVCVEGEGR